MRIALFVAVLLLGGTGCGGGKKSGSAPGIETARNAHNEVSILVRSVPKGSDADLALFREQGYQQGKDRPMQMDLMRRIGMGRLAEIFGERRTLVSGNDTALQRDLLMHSLGLVKGVKRSAEKLRNEFPFEYAALVAFSEGVNRAFGELESTQPEVLRILRSSGFTNNPKATFDPWEPEHCIASARNVAFLLSSSLEEKLDLGLISLAILQEHPMVKRLLGGGGAATAGKDPLGNELMRRTVMPLLEKGLNRSVTDLMDLRPIEDEFILNTDRSKNPFVKKDGALKSAWLDARPARKVKRNKLFDSEKKAALAKQMKEPAGICENRGFPFPDCFPESGFGSNNWVVSKQMAGGNSTFLANDPHLRLGYPMNFYAAALNSKPAGGTMKIRGFNIPGVPGILIGHNEFIQWGLTNLTADVNDVRFDFVTPDGNSVYTIDTEGAKKPKLALTSYEQEIKVRTSSGDLVSRTFTFREIPGFGPVISDYIPKMKKKFAALKQAMGLNVIASYKWTGHEATTEFVTILRLNRDAHDFESFREALKFFEVGAQNFIYADKQGNIGYFPHAKFPMRTSYLGVAGSEEGALFDFGKAKEASPKGTSSPLIPMIGYLGHKWDAKWREVPTMYNPPVGRIVTANNDPFGHSQRENLNNYEDYFGFEFSTGARAKRITEMLDGFRMKKGSLDLNDIKSTQRDHLDKMLYAMVSLLKTAGKDLTTDGGARALREKLEAWDGVMDRRQKMPVLADQFMRALSASFIESDFVPAPARADMRNIQRSAMFTKTLFNTVRDGLTGKSRKDKTEEAKRVSFERALWVLGNALEVAADSDATHHWSEVTWGEVHKIEFFNSLEGLLPSVPLPSLARDGYYDTVDVAGPGFGPNFRMVGILEEGKDIQVQVAVPGGNFPIHETAKIAEELERWRDGEYRDFVSFIP